MPSKLACQIAAVAITCFGLSAQNITIPAALDGVEGGSGSNVPFGSNLACRYQCIYDAAELPWTGPRQINSISLRADNGSPNSPGSPIAAKGFLIISVLMSTTHANPAAASGTFEDNWGEDRRWVLVNQPVQLPAQPAIPAGPRPANLDFVFTTPFFYGLTPARHNQPPPANLLVEIWILSQPSGAYPLDNLGGCVAQTTTFGNQDPLCTVPNSPAPTLDSDVSMTAGSSFSWYLHNGPPSSAFLLAFNVTNQGGLFNNPAFALPYPMFDPLNPSQPAPALASLNWSAPDCWLNIDPAVTIFAVTDASGDGIVPTNIPAGRENVGFELFTQAIVYSQTSNPLQAITTLGRSSTVCGPLSAVRVFAFYNGTGTPTPPPPDNGAVQYGLAPVLEVH